MGPLRGRCACASGPATTSPRCSRQRRRMSRLQRERRLPKPGCALRRGGSIPQTPQSESQAPRSTTHLAQCASKESLFRHDAACELQSATAGPGGRAGSKNATACHKRAAFVRMSLHAEVYRQAIQCEWGCKVLGGRESWRIGEEIGRKSGASKEC